MVPVFHIRDSAWTLADAPGELAALTWGAPTEYLPPQIDFSRFRTIHPARENSRHGCLAIKDINEVSWSYHRTIKRESVGRLLVNPGGSVYRKKECGSFFLYPRRLENGTKRHIHREKEDASHVPLMEEGVALRAIDVAKASLAQAAVIDEVKRIAAGLHEKWVKKMAAAAGKGGGKNTQYRAGCFFMHE